MGERRGSVHVNIPCPRQTQLKVIGDYHYAESKESLLGKGTFGHVWRCTRISDGFQVIKYRFNGAVMYEK